MRNMPVAKVCLVVKVIWPYVHPLPTLVRVQEIEVPKMDVDGHDNNNAMEEVCHDSNAARPKLLLLEKSEVNTLHTPRLVQRYVNR